jgi:hypothetical protein
MAVDFTAVLTLIDAKLATPLFAPGWLAAATAGIAPSLKASARENLVFSCA